MLFFVVGVRALNYSCIQVREKTGGCAKEGRERLFRIEINMATLYRGTSLIRNYTPLGPYRRTMSRALWRP